MPTESIFICGPTASGKSALALEIARERNGEIVNADAFQLYRGLETLTAAPGREEREVVPHHLYSILDPSEPVDAARYVDMARPVIDAIIARDRTPVVTGGSGLYLKFLTHGRSPVPPGDPSLRAELDGLPLDDLAARLQKIDPVEAARTNLKNRRYVTRALEICLLSGCKASEHRDQWETATREKAGHLHGILIRRTRANLHARIAVRTRIMLESGAIDEVARASTACDNVTKAIGFREIRDLISGAADLATCEERINSATRQYAKRQETWFRREAWLEVRPF